MNDKIVMVKIDEIQDHPEESKIYGAIETSEEFVASIADRGVLQPVILADAHVPKLLAKEYRVKGKGYFLVSGHRRKHGATLAGLTEIPAIVKSYNSYDETVLDLCISNKNREKTNAQRRREFLTIKQKLSQFGKLHMAKGIYEKSKYENDELSRFLETLKVKDRKPLDSVQLLIETTGFSEYEQRLIQMVYDLDYRDKQLAKLRKMKLPVKSETALAGIWQNWTEQAESKEVTLKEAYDAIKKQISKLTDKLNPKKKEKSRKQKAESKKTDSKLITELPSMGHTYSQTPAKYHPLHSTIDFILKSKGGDIGLIKTAKMPCGLCFQPKGSGSFYRIDLEELTGIITEELGD
jgi:ParB/RepB/Spo0J family partition protein